jgi:hypothetical protein
VQFGDYVSGSSSSPGLHLYNSYTGAGLFGQSPYYVGVAGSYDATYSYPSGVTTGVSGRGYGVGLYGYSVGGTSGQVGVAGTYNGSYTYWSGTGVAGYGYDHGTAGFTATGGWGVLGIFGTGLYSSTYGYLAEGGEVGFGAYLDGGDAHNGYAAFMRGNAYRSGASYQVLDTSRGSQLVAAVQSPTEDLMWSGTAEWNGESLQIRLPEEAREVVSADVEMRVLVTPVGSPAMLYVASVDKASFVVDRVDLPGLNSADSVTFNWMAITRLKGAEGRRTVTEAFQNAMELYPKTSSQTKIGTATTEEVTH